jgi:hypothetical protein
MRTAILLFALLSSFWAVAQVNPQNNYVDGYYKSDGSYVEGHYRTNPNGTVYDNYSTYPNVNPYTGQQGTKYQNTAPTYTVPVSQMNLFGQGQVQQYQFEAPQQQQGYYYTDGFGNTRWVPQ